MADFHAVETALLEHDDGSCRDVNFLEPTWDGVTTLIKRFEQVFGERTASDGEGNPLTEPHWQHLIASVLKTGYVHMVYRNSAETLTNVQAYVTSEDNGSPFIELTFFPEDLAQARNLGRDFIAWIDGAQTTLQARHYYCRFENASWSFGDVSRYSGVFFATVDTPS